MIDAVIGTNVIVFDFCTKNRDAATVRLLYAIYEHRITPVIHNGILQEYDEVLHRQKFHFDIGEVENTINFFRDNGTQCVRHRANITMPDEDDRIFLETAFAARLKFSTACLVTGNKRHFPAVQPSCVATVDVSRSETRGGLSPAELLAILSANIR